MKRILHKQIYRELKDGATINRTLCYRVTLTDDGMNMAETDQDVTCKLCLKKLKVERRP